MTSEYLNHKALLWQNIAPSSIVINHRSKTQINAFQGMSESNSDTPMMTILSHELHLRSDPPTRALADEEFLTIPNEVAPYDSDQREASEYTPVSIL